MPRDRAADDNAGGGRLARPELGDRSAPLAGGAARLPAGLQRLRFDEAEIAAWLEARHRGHATLAQPRPLTRGGPGRRRNALGPADDPLEVLDINPTHAALLTWRVADVLAGRDPATLTDAEIDALAEQAADEALARATVAERASILRAATAGGDHAR